MVMQGSGPPEEPAEPEVEVVAGGVEVPRPSPSPPPSPQEPRDVNQVSF